MKQKRYRIEVQIFPKDNQPAPIITNFIMKTRPITYTQAEIIANEQADLYPDYDNIEVIVTELATNKKVLHLV